MIAVLIPVLDRPQRAAPLIESLHASSSLVTEVVFLCSPGDDAQWRAAHETGVTTVTVDFPLDGGDYARKINYGVLCTNAEWIFQAGDDIRFHSHWDEIALARATEAAGVIGTNDLGNPLVKRGMHSTHSLIRRSYIAEQGTIDEPGKALHEGYWHCWVDNELIETAKYRRAYFAARRSHVEHLHHIWPDGEGGRKGRDDATYRRGQAHYREDNALYKARRPLWRGRLPGT